MPVDKQKVFWLNERTVALLTPRWAGDFALIKNDPITVKLTLEKIFECLRLDDRIQVTDLQVMLAEKHTDVVYCVGTKPKPRFFDGIIGQGPIGLIFFPADCIGFAFHDAQKGLIGLLHISRLTVGNGLIANFAKAWRDQGGETRETTIVALPGICKDCLSFPTKDFIDKIHPSLPASADGFVRRKNGLIYLDLKYLAAHLLKKQDFNLGKAIINNSCTVCDPNETFWSHRKFGSPRGAAIIIAS